MISGNLEYLVSSLPDLHFQNTFEAREKVSSLLKKYAGIDTEEMDLIEILDNEAEKFLPAQTNILLRKIDLNNIYKVAFLKSNSMVLSAFSKYTFDLKEDIRQLRISRKGGENIPSIERLKILLSQETPLENEIQIMKCMWDKLEELSVGHYANLEALITYKLKLMILLRWWSFNEDKGYKTFTQLTMKR